MAANYDEKAQATGWQGPAVVFGLAFKYTEPGQTLLDIGIGTGLGSALFHKAGLNVIGMDISEEMLEVCRNKGFAAGLVCHDLTVSPYPFGDASCDHAVSTGVFQFFREPGPGSWGSQPDPAERGCFHLCDRSSGAGRRFPGCRWCGTNRDRRSGNHVPPYLWWGNWMAGKTRFPAG